MLYDYKCKHCGATSELNVPMQERDSKYYCKACAGQLIAQISPVRAIFKGKGFPGNDDKPHNEGHGGT